MIDLDSLESAAKAATPGPWEHYVDQGCNGVLMSGKVILPTLHISPENCAYIAAANPAVILKLVAELRKARAERDWLARTFGNLQDTECPPSRRRWSRKCRKTPCEQCWLEAAHNAVEEKQEGEQ